MKTVLWPTHFYKGNPFTRRDGLQLRWDQGFIETLSNMAYQYHLLGHYLWIIHHLLGHPQNLYNTQYCTIHTVAPGIQKALISMLLKISEGNFIWYVCVNKWHHSRIKQIYLFLFFCTSQILSVCIDRCIFSFHINEYHTYLISYVAQSYFCLWIISSTCHILISNLRSVVKQWIMRYY